MDKFWELLNQSTIVQGMLTLLLWGGIVYLTIVGEQVPDVLSQAGAIVLGFWFAEKAQVSKIKALSAKR